MMSTAVLETPEVVTKRSAMDFSSEQYAVQEDTVPTSAQPKEEGASSTGEEPPSVYWMALVLCACCVCVCVFVFACVCVCVCLYINMAFHTTSRSTVRGKLNVSPYVCSGHHTFPFQCCLCRNTVSTGY